MRQRYFFILILFKIIDLASGSASFAAEPGNGSVGLMLGPNFASLTHPGLGLGLKGNYRLLPVMRVGAFYQLFLDGIESSDGAGIATLSASTSMSLFGAEEITTFGANGNFGIGFRMGFARNQVSFTAADASNTVTADDGTTDFFFAPVVTYDHFIGKFSIGGEVSYFLTFKAITPNVFSLLATFKFWF